MDTKSDFDFPEASLFSSEYSTLSENVRCEALRATASAFSDTLTKIQILGELPFRLVFWSGVFQMIEGEVLKQFPDQKGSPGNLVNVAVNNFRMNLFYNWVSGRLIDPVAGATEEREVGASNLEFFAQSESPLSPGLDAVLSAMILNGWMAFETLASDLWIAAVNECPAILADSVIRSSSQSRGVENENNEGRSVRLKSLSDYNYNIGSVMGDFLFDTKRVSFETLDGIKRAYASAFDTGTSKGSQELFGAFRRLSGVQALRNVFAHRGGLVTRNRNSDFRVIEGLENVEIGTTITLTGAVTRTCLTEIVGCGVSLFKFVDGWLNEHASECRTIRDRRNGL